jgi:hypothetical protein
LKKKEKMKREDKKRLITDVLAKDPHCTECGKLMFNSFDLPYPPKIMPNDAAIVATRGDNGKKWVMCAECSELQHLIRNERIKQEAKISIDAPKPEKVSIKELSADEIRHKIHLNEVATKVILNELGVPDDKIHLVKGAIRENFHLKYYLRFGKFLSEEVV